jgi:glycosyltransferase involved in cell wall biosynthesis
MSQPLKFHNLKILYFSQLYYPFLFGGGEQVFFNYGKQLAGKGHKVFVISSLFKKLARKEVLGNITISRVGPPLTYQGGLPVGFFENLCYIPLSILNGVQIICQKQIDVIHSNAYVPAFAGQICAFFFHKPHIITIHDVCFPARKDRFIINRSPVESKIGKLVERLVLHLPATIFQTVSETSKNDIEEIVSKNCIVIPNGIDARQFDTSLSERNGKKYQLIYIGRLVEYKNVATLIRAMRKVVQIFPDSALVVVGDGPSRQGLEMLATQLNVKSNVIFKGRVPEEEKIILLKESSFLVLPSLFEGFGIVIIEGFACKKPVLVSNIMPMSEIVENGQEGFLVKPLDYADWSDKILFLFEHPELIKEMGINGRRKFEEKFDLKTTANELESYYYKVLRKVDESQRRHFK